MTERRFALIGHDHSGIVPEVNDLSDVVTWANIPIANVPTGTTSSTVALGNHLHAGVYEPVDTTLVRDDDAGYNKTNWDTAYGWGDPASGGYYSASGGVISGAVTIESSNDGILSLKQTDIAGTQGVKDPGWNYIQFLDSEGDRQGYFGINTSGDFVFEPEITGNVKVAGSFVVTAANIGSYAALPSHTHSFVVLGDTRAVDDLPDAFDRETNWTFKQRSTLGFPGDETYGGVLFVAPWVQGGGGGGAYQMSLSILSGVVNLGIRTGDNTTWDTWYSMYHTGNFTDNSSNWDTAYGWGDHASGGYSASAHTHDGITDTNLLDKSAAETITGIYRFADYIRMNNNIKVRGLNNAGSSLRDMLHISTADKVTLGDVNVAAQIFSNAAPVWYDGTNSHTIMTNLLEDTTPQLGGTLELNSNVINDAATVALRIADANALTVVAGGIYCYKDVFARDGNVLRAYSPDNTKYMSIAGGASYATFTNTGLTRFSFIGSQIFITDNNLQLDSRGNSGTGVILQKMENLSTAQILRTIYDHGNVALYRQYLTAGDGWYWTDVVNNRKFLDYAPAGQGILKVRDGVNFRHFDSTDTKYMTALHNSTDYLTAFVNTGDWAISGVDNNYKFDKPILVNDLAVPHYVSTGFVGGKITVSSSEPGTPTKGDIWFDTT